MIHDAYPRHTLYHYGLSTTEIVNGQRFALLSYCSALRVKPDQYLLINYPYYILSAILYKQNIGKVYDTGAGIGVIFTEENPEKALKLLNARLKRKYNIKLNGITTP